MKDVTSVVDWMKSLQTFGIKPGLERMEWMLEKLGNPERRLKFIHIAGTNGKGSTATYLASVLQTANYDVGTFMSPHIDSFFSRITYNQAEIGAKEVIDIGNRLKALSDELATTPHGAATEFEILTMMAIVYFAQYTYPDVVVWETGLGGKFDSTNVVHPILSIITNVSYDHMHILGNSIEDIAAEKAGIIKSGVPVVTSVEHEDAFRVINNIAIDKNAKVYRLGKDFNYSVQSSSDEQHVFSFTGPFGKYESISLGLRGPHQFKNAAVSLMALEVLRQYYALIFEQDELMSGFENAFIPGRFEIVQNDPLIILDGAHNPHGAKALTATIKELYPERKGILVLSILQDKLIDEMVEELLPIASQVIITKANNPRAIAPELIQEKIKSKSPHLPIYIEEGPEGTVNAVKKALSMAVQDDMVIVTGSLYLISNVRQELLSLLETKVGGM